MMLKRIMYFTLVCALIFILTGYRKVDINGSGTNEDPFLIYNFASLELVGDEEAGFPLDAYYQLANDIDASATRSEFYNQGRGWRPIAKYSEDGFQGVFDGAGYQIRGLYINQDSSYLGLFRLNEGLIKNTNLVDVEIRGNSFIGALAAENRGKIIDSYAESYVRGDDSSVSVGGLVATNIEGEIKRSHTQSKVVGSNNVGGLVGNNLGGKIIESYALANVEGKQENIGGLVGSSSDARPLGYGSGLIERSFFKGEVKGNTNVGGLVGINLYASSIEDSYVQAKVAGEELVGGLVGLNNGFVGNSYSSAKVLGTGELGGLVASNSVLGNGGMHNFAEDGVVKNSYWDLESSRQNKSAGGEAKTSQEMKEQATYQDWDFENVWSIDEGESYPDFILSSDIKEEVETVHKQVEVKVEKALRSLDLDNIIAREEHCTIDSSLAQKLDLELGQQIRVIVKDAPAKYAIYTIGEIIDEGENIIRMGLNGRRRLNQREPFKAYLSTEVVSAELETKEEARENNELVESLADQAENRDLVAIAPHGGSMEGYTDGQSTALANSSWLADYGVSVWNCYGYQSRLGAYAAWHITSGDINERNFPKLNRIVDRGFKFAVAFHGYRAEGHQVILGGNTDYMLSEEQSFKERIKELIIENSDGQIKVHLAQPGDRLAGYSPDNIVNRLASRELGGYGGIQIESSMAVREDYRYQVVEAIAQALAEALAN